MKFINFTYLGKECFGIVTNRGIIDLEMASKKHQMLLPQTLEQAFAYSLNEFEKLLSLENETIAESEVEYLPVVLDPAKIFCIGFNYIDHSKEANVDLPTHPVVFSKFSNTLSHHLQEIEIPKWATQLDYEAELVVVMGKEAHQVTKEDALSYVFGYTCGNDITDRALQFRTSQWLIGKSLDHCAPIGPYLVTSDEINPNDLTITCKLNQKIVQKASTKDMIFDVSTIISYLSQFFTLLPGDIIFTGTPAGVILGKKAEEQVWLKDKDVVEVTIESIGTLKNSFYRKG